MIQESDLAKAASRLIRAEKEYIAIKDYYDNMPADPDFDLGLRVEWNWGSSTNGSNRNADLPTQVLRKELRGQIGVAVGAARDEMLAAQRALKAAA